MKVTCDYKGGWHCSWPACALNCPGRSPTGRIVTESPEMQRIPHRTPDIVELRRMQLEEFRQQQIPANYSSIEARMLAHVESSTRDKLKYAPRALEAWDRYSASHERYKRLDTILAVAIGILASLIAATPLICWAILYWD